MAGRLARENSLVRKTIEEALHLRDCAVRLPARRDDPFKKAAREENRTAEGKLDL